MDPNQSQSMNVQKENSANIQPSWPHTIYRPCIYAFLNGHIFALTQALGYAKRMPNTRALRGPIYMCAKSKCGSCKLCCICQPEKCFPTKWLFVHDSNENYINQNSSIWRQWWNMLYCYTCCFMLLLFSNDWISRNSYASFWITAHCGWELDRSSLKLLWILFIDSSDRGAQANT